MNLVNIYTQNKKVIRGMMFFIGLLFIFFLFNESWSEVSGLIYRMNINLFALSIIIGIAGNIIAAILFNRFLYKYGLEISDSYALRIYLIGQIAKYIPGKIWSIAYQTSYVKKASGAITIALANLELMISVIVMTTVMSFVLICFNYSAMYSIVAFFFGMLFFNYIYNSTFINKLAYYLGNKVKRSQDVKKNIKKNSHAEASILYLLFCSVFLLSNMLMLQSVFSFTINEAILYVSVLSASWVLGVLAFIFPAGIGVREFLFIFFSNYITPDQSLEILVSIAIVSRLWQITQEVLVSLLLIIRKDNYI